MKRAFIFSAIFAIINFLSIELNASVKMHLQGPEKDATFELLSPALDKPLFIKGYPEKNKGSIFFETDKGKTWLRGKPYWTDKSKKFFHGKWHDNNQEISILIKPDKNDFIVKFSSIKGPEIKKWGFNLDAGPNEYFTGLLERVVDGSQSKSWKKNITTAMDLRGQTIEMLVKHTLSVYAPFYISSRNYGIFTHGSWPGEYDLCDDIDDLVQIAFEGPHLSFKIYTSKNPLEIVKAHAMEAGPPRLPPKWTFTHWRWRDDHTQRDTYYDGTKVNAPYNSEAVEDILMMEAYGIPCGVYWVDRPWAVGKMGYEDFNWDRERLPNPERMIKWLEKKNMKFVLWIAPWVLGDMAKTAIKKGYHIKPNTKGKKKGNSDRVLVDFSNPKAKKWWQEQGVAKVLKIGVKGFKLDRGEEQLANTISKDGNIYDGRSYREIRNDYVVQYAEAVYQISKKIHGDDFVLLPRAAYTGSSKYACFWGGDISSSQEGLRASIISLLRSSVMGYPFWGSDTGGYKGRMIPEVCARWLAFSCFSPIMEVGPTENTAFWHMPKKKKKSKTSAIAPGDSIYNAELIAIWRVYARLHTDLIDYSYKCAQEAHKTGMPVARPLFLIYPEQKQAWKDWQTYLYGPDILVSPIWKQGKDRHTLYLPSGEKWIDAWDKKKIYNGGKKITVDAPLYKIPIFYRKGSNLDLGDLHSLYKESLKIAKKKPDLAKLQQKEFGR